MIFPYILLGVTRKAWPVIKHHTQTLYPKRSCLGKYPGQLPPAYWIFKSLLVAIKDTGSPTSNLALEWLTLDWAQGSVQRCPRDTHSLKTYHLLLNILWHLLQGVPHYHKKPIKLWYQLCYHIEFLFYAIERALLEQFRRECITYPPCRFIKRQTEAR